MSFSSGEYWTPIKLSIEIASISLILVFLLGIFFARFIAKRQFRGKMIVETFFLLPIVLPPTVVGFLLIYLFGNNSPIGQFLTGLFHQSVMFTTTAAIIAATVVSFPLMYQTVKLGFESVDPSIEEAAKVDGANEWSVFYHISLPLSIKSIISGLVLSFARALGEFGATFMFAGNIPGKTQTAPIAIYVAMDSGNMGLAWTLVLSMVFLSVIMLITVNMIKSHEK